MLVAFFPGHEHGKGSHMSLLYKPDSLLSPSRPLANRTLWEIRFLECVLTQNFDIRSKYSSTRDRCPDSEAAVSQLFTHLCEMEKNILSACFPKTGWRSPHTDLFPPAHQSLQFPGPHQHVETPWQNRPPCKGYKNSNAFYVSISEAILSVCTGGLSWSNLQAEAPTLFCLSYERFWGCHCKLVMKAGI